jgi:hypothetical protein
MKPAMMSYAEAAQRVEGLERGGRCWCPAHDDRRGQHKSLSLRPDADGSAWPVCFSGCGQGDIIAALRAEPVKRAFGLPTGASNEGDETERIEYARRIWNQAKPAAGTIVGKYLTSRSINLIPSTIRFSNLKHPSGATLPCLIAAVTNIGRTGWYSSHLFKSRRSQSRHRKPNKMALGPCRGSSVHLAAANSRLAIVEGIETGLSILQATGLPTWACLGTAGLKTLELPEVVAEVVIAADNDAPGIRAAREAALRFIRLARKVRIAEPPAGLRDFNDALKAVMGG